MGSKEKPGKFDCYANAKPDEPMFTLLGRDPVAGACVRAWVELRAIHVDPGELEKFREALACSMAMDSYCGQLGKEPKGNTEYERGVRCALAILREQLRGRLDDSVIEKVLESAKRHAL